MKPGVGMLNPDKGGVAVVCEVAGVEDRDGIGGISVLSTRVDLFFGLGAVYQTNIYIILPYRWSFPTCRTGVIA